VPDCDKQIQKSFQGLFKDLECTGSSKFREREISWHITSLLARLSVNFFPMFPLIILAMYVAVHEANSKNSQISRSVLNR